MGAQGDNLYQGVVKNLENFNVGTLATKKNDNEPGEIVFVNKHISDAQITNFTNIEEIRPARSYTGKHVVIDNNCGLDIIKYEITNTDDSSGSIFKVNASGLIDSVQFNGMNQDLIDINVKKAQESFLTSNPTSIRGAIQGTVVTSASDTHYADSVLTTNHYYYIQFNTHNTADSNITANQIVTFFKNTVPNDATSDAGGYNDQSLKLVYVKPFNSNEATFVGLLYEVYEAGTDGFALPTIKVRRITNTYATFDNNNKRHRNINELLTNFSHNPSSLDTAHPYYNINQYFHNAGGALSINNGRPSDNELISFAENMHDYLATDNNNFTVSLNTRNITGFECDDNGVLSTTSTEIDSTSGDTTLNMTLTSTAGPPEIFMLNGTKYGRITLHMGYTYTFTGVSFIKFYTNASAVDGTHILEETGSGITYSANDAIITISRDTPNPFYIHRNGSTTNQFRVIEVNILNSVMIDDEQNPTLTLYRENTYTFEKPSSMALLFYSKNDIEGAEYLRITNPMDSTGSTSVTLVVDKTTQSTLYYTKAYSGTTEDGSADFEGTINIIPNLTIKDVFLEGTSWKKLIPGNPTHYPLELFLTFFRGYTYRFEITNSSATYGLIIKDHVDNTRGVGYDENNNAITNYRTSNQQTYEKIVYELVIPNIHGDGNTLRPDATPGSDSINIQNNELTIFPSSLEITINIQSDGTLVANSNSQNVLEGTNTLTLYRGNTYTLTYGNPNAYEDSDFYHHIGIRDKDDGVYDTGIAYTVNSGKRTSTQITVDNTTPRTLYYYQTRSNNTNTRVNSDKRGVIHIKYYEDANFFQPTNYAMQRRLKITGIEKDTVGSNDYINFTTNDITYGRPYDVTYDLYYKSNVTEFDVTFYQTVKLNTLNRPDIYLHRGSIYTFTNNVSS